MDQEEREEFFSYQIPPEYKQQFSKDLMLTFGNELLKIFSKDFTLGEIVMNFSSTTGWDLAFHNACDKCDKKDLYEYYRHLTWYDSDLFDDEVEELFYEYKITRRTY